MFKLVYLENKFYQKKPKKKLILIWIVSKKYQNILKITSVKNIFVGIQ